MLWSDEAERPLKHIRVVDLTVLLPGPYLTRMLAQLGAEVIKVEAAPNGDTLRATEQTDTFQVLNQGKKSIAVNLRTEQGIQIIRQLASESDIVVENFREGVMDRLGLGYIDMSENNPELIYVSLRGLSGKASQQAGHDFNFIANSGVGEWFLESGVPNYSTQFGDIVGGTLMPMIRLLSHLASPERKGMQIMNYMDEGFRSLFLPRAYDEIRKDSLPADQKATFGINHFFNGREPHSRYYQCRDGQWVAVNAIQEKHWKHFCELVDKKAWTERQRDRTLLPELELLFKDAPAAYWESLLGATETCVTRVVPWEEHLQLSTTKSQLSSDPLTWMGFAANPTLKAAPKVGEDTMSVLSSLGMDPQQIAEAIHQGVIKSQ